MHYINERLLENIEHKRLSIFEINFSKRNFLQTVNKTTASQNVERRHKSNIIEHPIHDVGHEISRRLPNGPRYGRFSDLKWWFCTGSYLNIYNIAGKTLIS